MEEVLQKPIKTYVNTRKHKLSKKSSPKSSNPRRKVLVAIRKPLTTKKAVELLLKGTLKRTVCRYCLNIAYPLSDLDQCLSIGGQGALYNVAIRDMVASFHPFKVVDDPNLPNKICPKCINQALRSYLFVQQCEQAERALRNCFDDINDKMQKLDPLEPTKKRGKQKSHPNHNVLYAEHAKVIDYAEPIRNLINSGSVSLTNETEMSELECKKCWQVFPNVESLVNHEKIHPKTMWYHCRVCGQSFSKLFHIRRHLKTKHSSKAKSTSDNQTFTCKQCAFASEDYNSHLQHVEKHKFKNVLEHLVERKMDDLCSVCLDKGALQDLEKTIHLHGAYPELTGNRSLYNILGSTIPEKEKHKYKELLVPSYANVLTITKKDKNNTLVRCGQAKELNLNTFTISNPFIVSKESVGDKHMGIFIFPEPKILFSNSTKEENVGKVDELLKENNADDDDKRSKMNANNFEKETLNILKNNIDTMEEAGVNSGEQNNVAMTFKTRHVNETDDESKTCTFCWVFKKTGQCDVCKNKFLVNSIDPKTAKCFENEAEDCTIDTDIAIVGAVENCMTAYSTEDNRKECYLCWVFKTTGKFGNCQKSFKKSCTNSKTEAVLDTVNIPENLDKIERNQVQKRKADEIGSKTNKKSRWECSICLTANDNNRDACLCCDAKALKDDSLKINFGSKSTFFKGIHEISKQSHLSFTDTTNDTIEINNVIDDLTDNSNKNMEFNDTPSILDKAVTISNDESNEMQCSDDSQTANEKLDVNKLPQEWMPMDFEDIDNMNKPTSPAKCMPDPIQNNTINFFTPITTVQTSANSQPKTFQFSIGSSPQDMKPARKFKRPLRRIATTIYK